MGSKGNISYMTCTCMRHRNVTLLIVEISRQADRISRDRTLIDVLCSYTHPKVKSHPPDKSWPASERSKNIHFQLQVWVFLLKCPVLFSAVTLLCACKQTVCAPCETAFLRVGTMQPLKYCAIDFSPGFVGRWHSHFLLPSDSNAPTLQVQLLLAQHCGLA